MFKLTRLTTLATILLLVACSDGSNGVSLAPVSSNENINEAIDEQQAVETDASTQPDPLAGLDTGTEAVADSGNEPNVVIDTGTGTETNTETNTGTETGTGSEATTGTDNGTESDTGSETKPGTGTGPETDTGSETDSGTGTDNGTDTDSGTDSGNEPPPAPPEPPGTDEPEGPTGQPEQPPETPEPEVPEQPPEPPVEPEQPPEPPVEPEQPPEPPVEPEQPPEPPVEPEQPPEPPVEPEQPPEPPVEPEQPPEPPVEPEQPPEPPVEPEQPPEPPVEPEQPPEPPVEPEQPPEEPEGPEQPPEPPVGPEQPPEEPEGPEQPPEPPVGPEQPPEEPEGPEQPPEPPEEPEEPEFPEPPAPPGPPGPPGPDSDDDPIPGEELIGDTVLENFATIQGISVDIVRYVISPTGSPLVELQLNNNSSNSIFNVTCSVTALQDNLVNGVADAIFADLEPIGPGESAVGIGEVAEVLDGFSSITLIRIDCDWVLGNDQSLDIVNGETTVEFTGYSSTSVNPAVALLLTNNSARTISSAVCGVEAKRGNLILGVAYVVFANLDDIRPGEAVEAVGEWSGLNSLDDFDSEPFDIANANCRYTGNM